MDILKKCFSLLYDKRSEHRYSLLGYFSGQFTRESSEEETFAVHPIDVSKFGLGLLINPVPAENEIIIYQNDPITEPIRFRIKHVHLTKGSTKLDTNLARCGLQTEDDKEIISIFSQSLSLMIQE
ncbi:MAG: hypothetical protein HRU19_24210 [Pseudobacteriovorax sp.]|nr:hypothetical protein [Pseudobacteriovorax sp.]